ncbi:hypothetical protein PR202_ga28365 [Eleusine coracana subsp. coracana]|uniref:CSC1-like protein ERD4 n=1 Tax=Eleusine coracana subsp. coracana TaxID=191504 RepID=A0AAV5DHJ3_ELECO|nr:hypothetical protein PR202_ga28365 [Eleusine coracana subsp. coracana]
MDLASFITSLLTSFVIFVALVLVFTWLSRRPGNAPVYYPNLLLRGLDPWEGRRRGTRSPVGWIRDAISASEPDVVAAGGVDAAVYLVFLSSVLAILVLSGMVLLPVLLPVAGTDHALELSANDNKSNQNFSQIEILALGNIQADKIYQEIEDHKRKITRAEVVYAESKTASKPEGTRPTHRTGFLGLIGTKVDTIEYCNEKIKELVPELEAEQKATLREKQQPAALVFFNSRSAAASASQTLHAQVFDKWTVMEAPEPRDIIWPNLSRKIYERQIRQVVVYFIVFLIVLFYTIPLGIIAAVTTLEKLREKLPFLKVVVDQPEIKTVLQAYLPQLALIVFLALLPSLLLFLSKSEGIPSHSHTVRAASGKYFYFIVFNVFLGYTIGSTLLNSLTTLINSPTKIVGMLANSLPRSATFFLTFVALKFFVGYGLELSRIVPFIIFHLKRKYLCKTEDEVKAAWAPGNLSYNTRVPNDMLITTVVLCYSVIAPLIIPFGVVYFALGWLVAKNQVLRVYVPSYESNGRMWPHMHNRIIAALVVYQITMIGVIPLKEFYYSPILVPLLPMSIIFAYICHMRFYPSFTKTPLEVAQHELKERPNMEAIYSAYIPPCLKPDKLEDLDVFEDAQSHTTSRAPSI